MRSLRSETPLGELLDVLIDHRGKTPNKLGGEFSASGVPVVSAIHIKGGQIKWDERERYVSPEMFQVWMPVPLKKGDLLVTSEAPLGEVALVPSDDPLVLSQRLFALRGKPKVLDTRFLMYFFKSPEGQRRLQSRASGTTVQGIRQSELVKISIPLPDYREQCRIAFVLEAMDELIAVNQLLIAKLGSLGQNLYDQLIAKSADTATRVSLASTVEIISGGTPSTSVSSYWGGEIPWFSVVDTPANGAAWVIETTKKITAEGLKNCAARLLPVGSTILTARGTVGQTALVGVPMTINQSCYALRSLVGSRGIFTYFCTRGAVRELKQGAHGSVFDTITRSSLENVKVSLPSTTDITHFEDVASPIMEQSRACLEEMKVLEKTRDELLPLLLSGAITVKQDAA